MSASGRELPFAHSLATSADLLVSGRRSTGGRGESLALFPLFSHPRMGVRPPRAIGEFSWQSADIAVECGRCGETAVYCDWKAQTCFRERGWSLSVADPVRFFRCRCGSSNVRLRPIAIVMRPKPIPNRLAALRPIYRESARTRFRRAPTDFPDRAGIETALAVLRWYVSPYGGDEVPEAELSAALERLRPFCYRQNAIYNFRAAGSRPDGVAGWQSARAALTYILRELGRQPE